MDGGGLPRLSRIGEFFPAKKRWPSSADESSSSKLNALTSSNTKRTSDSNVTFMENGEFPSKMFRILDSLKQREGFENKDQNLYTAVINKERSQSTSFVLQRCSSKSKDSEGNEGLQKPINKDVSKSKENDVTDAAAEVGKQENELNKFANDFLSICCSGIISTVTQAQAALETGGIGIAVDNVRDSGIDTDIAGNKLSDNAPTSTQAKSTSGCNCKKNSFQSAAVSRDVSTDVSTFTEGHNVGVISTTVCQETPAFSSVKPPEVLMQAVAASPAFGSPTAVNLQKGSASGLSKRKSISTPCTKSATKRRHPTPGWSAGATLFSPGDEFWDEAICVVDGLACDKVDGVSNPSDVVEDRRNRNSCPYAKACHFISSKLSDNSKEYGPLREDRVSLSDRMVHEQNALDPETGGTTLPDSATLLSAKSTCQRACYGMQEGFKCVNAEVSPLPVRRFDFSNSPDKEDGHKDLICAETASCLLVGSGAVVEVAASMPAVDQSSQVKSGCYGADEFGMEPKKTVTQVHCDQFGETPEEPVTVVHFDNLNNNDGESTETMAILQQRRSSHILDKSDHTFQDVAAAVCLPISSTAKLKTELSDWLPGPIFSVYAKKGLKRLYSWQVDCLQLEGVLEGKNLVYCASTSAGKSLVAEILMLRMVITTGKKALLVLPYVSICSEKAEHLQSLLEPSCKKVCSFFGSHGGASLPKDSSVAVCTIEKANLLINRLLEEGRLPELAVVVIDELHMVGDKDRGYLLELMLTKLRYAAGEGNDLNYKAHEDDVKGTEMQIIGMSATMPNAAAVAKWLQAALYETNFRPVPLDEFIKVANVIYDKNMEVIRTMKKSADLAGKDPDHVVELCHEVVQEGHSVLLFCSSRKACETSAKHVAKFLPAHELMLLNSTPGPDSTALALEELQKCPAGLDPVLAETIPKGVAYHHAGLTVEEREIVEACYRSGIVRVLTATSTLAAGVNLPARRVIFRQPRIGKDFVDGTRYKQMSGRAGRAGIDTRGESILICKPEELKRMCSLLNEECQPLMSCLADDKNGMTRAILEVVAGGIVQSAIDVERYVKCTLLNSTQSFQEVVKSAQDSLRWLCHRKLLEWDHNTELYSCTPLGKAAFGSSLSPEESLIVFEDLAKAREAFVLASDLHLLYQVTPIHVELEPDWGLYYKKFVELSQMDQAVGNRIGVMEPFLMRMAHGAPIVEVRNQSTGRSPRRKQFFLSPGVRKSGRNSSKTPSVDQTLRVCKRFFVSLMLAKLVQEVPLMDVCDSFKVARGMVQALQETSGRFASMVSAFCDRLGWHDLEGLITKFQSRVCFGVRAEIVELAEIPFVKASRARALYKAGLRTPQAVAEATLSELAKALFDSSSWASQDGAKAIGGRHRVQMGMARKIQNGARKLVLERAEAARVAAFSTLRALGVDVPPSLSEFVADTKVMDGHQSKESKTPKNMEAHENHNNPQNLDNLARNASPILSEGTDRLSSKGDARGHLHQALKPSIEMGNKSLVNGNDSLNQGPVDVNSLPGGFDQFYSLFETVDLFFFDLHFCLIHQETEFPTYNIKGIAICWIDSPIYYVSIGETDTTHSANNDEELLCAITQYRWTRLTARFCANGLQKVTWNWKFQVLAFCYPSFSVKASSQTKQISGEKLEVATKLPGVGDMGSPIDLQIAMWLLWPDEESAQSFTLEQEMRNRLPGNLAAKASREGRWINQMGKVAHNGCCRRAAQIRALHSVIWKMIVADGLDRPLVQQEMPLVRLLAELEAFGITVDMEGCKQARQQLEMKIKELENKARELAGVFFSLSAPAEVASVLYTHLNLPVPAGYKKKSQHPSTDKQALDALKGHHPIVDVIKEYRTVSKVLQSTLGSILFKARPIITRDGGHHDGNKSIAYRVKGHWLQTSTATGRLSMEEPNLQCVEHPLKFTIMQRPDDHMKEQFSVECIVNARNFFLPSQEGWILLSADYSQIEVRLMAHFSGDPALIEILSRPTGDLFKIITAQWMGLAEADVTGTQRDLTKKLVYGILYGMGVSALADQLECSLKEAAERYKRFKVAFPGVGKWLKEAVIGCRNKGYICTLAGRRRYLEKIKYGNLSERSKAERQAVNSICQGSAADLIKNAMNKLFSVGSLGKGSLSLDLSQKASLFTSVQGKFRLLLQIHDELVLEVEKSSLPETAAFLQSCMEGAGSLKVPLRVKLKYGLTWGSLQPFEGI